MNANKKASGKADNRPAENVKSRVEGSERRPRRSDGTGFRNLLTVEGQDPAYHYRWISDSHERGSKILGALAKDYDFVVSDSVSVGEDNIFRSTKDGSIIRVPAGGENGDFLYLMRKHKDWHDADVAAKHQAITDQERGMISDPTDGGELYGSISIDRN